MAGFLPRHLCRMHDVRCGPSWTQQWRPPRERRPILLRNLHSRHPSWRLSPSAAPFRSRATCAYATRSNRGLFISSLHLLTAQERRQTADTSAREHCSCGTLLNTKACTSPSDTSSLVAPRGIAASASRGVSQRAAGAFAILRRLIVELRRVCRAWDASGSTNGDVTSRPCLL